MRRRMTEEQFWKLLDRLTKQVVENENCVLNVVIGYYGQISVQLIPKDIWFEGIGDEDV